MTPDPRSEPVLIEPAHLEAYGLAIKELFYELTKGRQSGFNGPQLMSWTDIQAWVELNEYEFTSWEIQTFKALDAAFVAAINTLIQSRTK